MKTTFYISWEVRKTNGAKCWYVSKMFDTKEDAKELFDSKIQRRNVTEAHLWKADDYTDASELPFEETCNRTPWGWRHTDLLTSFQWGKIKTWMN